MRKGPGLYRNLRPSGYKLLANGFTRYGSVSHRFVTRNLRMKNRKIYIVGLLLLLLSLTSNLKAQAKPEGKPNVVIIMADDLDSKQLSCYGGQNIRTTHIDALARRRAEI